LTILRENAYKMTREDVLRELELLPVWTLRAPLPQKSIIEPTPLNVETVETVLDVPVRPNIIEKDIIETPQAVSNPAILIISNDKKWTFVLPNELTGQAADLFNNILRALSINKTQPSQTQDLMQDIAGLNVGVVVAVGEKIAQQLLASTQPLEILRGKMHDTNGLQVVVTYHPDDLLLHLANKAKTWDDLCMAIDAISR
jgi:DNA polymerase